MSVTGVVNVIDLVKDSTGKAVAEDGRPIAVRIESGAYTTPFQLVVQGGPTLTITSLPWQGVVVGMST